MISKIIIYEHKKIISTCPFQLKIDILTMAVILKPSLPPHKKEIL